MSALPQLPRPDRTAAELRVLDVAEEMFLGLPRDAITIAEIASRAKVSVGLIYLRFGSKYGLYAAVREQIHIEFIDFTLAGYVDDAQLSISTVLGYCTRWERAIQRDFDRAKLLGSGSGDLSIPDDHMAAVNQRIRDRISIAVAELGRRIEVLVNRRAIRPCDPYATARWMFTSIWGAGLLLMQAPAGTATPEVIAGLFGHQRMIVAQVLLPIAALNDDGTVPERYLN